MTKHYTCLTALMNWPLPRTVSSPNMYHEYHHLCKLCSIVFINNNWFMRLRPWQTKKGEESIGICSGALQSFTLHTWAMDPSNGPELRPSLTTLYILQWGHLVSWASYTCSQIQTILVNCILTSVSKTSPQLSVQFYYWMTGIRFSVSIQFISFMYCNYQVCN